MTVPTLPADFCGNYDEAYTIPAEFYTREDVFEIEKDRVFANAWLCVSHCSELAEPNSFITREVIGESIAIVRGVDNVLRAFYNVCPHRGHQLLSGSGKSKNVITCPYHAWTFKLDGQLAFARNCADVVNFDAGKSNLSPVRVEEYAGFVFVNLNPNAEPVEAQLPGLEAKLRETCPNVEQLHLGARFVTNVKANWKAVVDNYMECYHCAPAHPGFSDSVRMETYTHTLHGNWTLQFGHARPSDKGYNFEDSANNHAFSGFWAWPCTMFNVPPGDGFMTALYQFPVSADVTLQHYDVYFVNRELTDAQKKLLDWYRDVFSQEDLRLVESVQRGLRSRGYRGQGRIMVDRARSGLSEHGIAHFHHLVGKVHAAA
jgi:phenylpropionate dioxygenase-like ring-hydroxylating dioxygenase large terminal subunit